MFKRDCESDFFYLASHLSWGRGTIASGWVASPLHVVLNQLWQRPCVLLPHKMQPQIVLKQSGNGESSKSCTITGRSIGCNLVLRNYQLLPNGRLRSHFSLERTCFYTWVTHYKRSDFLFSWCLCESTSKIKKKGRKKKKWTAWGLNPQNVTWVNCHWTPI